MTPQYEHSAFQVLRETDVWSGKILEGTRYPAQTWTALEPIGWRNTACGMHPSNERSVRPSLVVGYNHVYGGKKYDLIERELHIEASLQVAVRMKNGNFQLISAILALIEIFFEIKYDAWLGIYVLLVQQHQRNCLILLQGYLDREGQSPQHMLFAI